MKRFMIVVKEHDRAKVEHKLKKLTTADIEFGDINYNAGEITVEFSVLDKEVPGTQSALNRWFCKGHHKPAPFPQGTLLFWQSV